ncbi:Serine/threonine protein kinase [Phytophthora palmivora]|uniref:Serine/threonine protein kinase n=1 Tax=Phytophthora palmivora TaxID=4796 RepID=A0A2P4WW64_9STRA|nr:Serine/threonine protein kinase [Phytophthora palmivora]
MSGFLVGGLNITRSSVEVLDDLTDRIPVRMPETVKLCSDLLDRLKQSHDPVAEHPNDTLRDVYCKILVRFARLLTAKPLLVRLAKSDTTLIVIKELHCKLDSIFEALVLDDTSDWERNWDAGCAQQRNTLKTLVTDRTAHRLANEVDGDKKLKDAIMQLRDAIDMDPTGELSDLRRSILDRVLECKGLNGMAIYEWFVSRDDVDYEDEAIGLVGTFAEARRGMWLHCGERQDVVVKILFFDTDDNDEDKFLKQLVFWYNLPQHDNILKLYGGNHVSSPPYFICEDAHNGNLLEFLEEKENQKHFWKVFLDVAKGIKHLHDRKIAHGSLKGNNILIGDGNVAKIADFGFSSVRSLSLNLSDKGSVALSQTVRWKSKEVLEGSGLDEPRLESDIYALGMCMIEAITQAIPFGMDNDDDVVGWVRDGQLPTRPPKASEEVWELIRTFCVADFRERPSIDDVIVVGRLYSLKR